MRFFSCILIVAAVAAVATPSQAAPPMSAKAGRKTFASPSAPRNGGLFTPKAVPQIQPRFNPPASRAVKPAQPTIRPGRPVIRPVQPLVTPRVLPMERVAPTITFKQPGEQPTRKPIADRDFVLKDNPRGPMAGPQRGPIHIADGVVVKPGVGPIRFKDDLDRDNDGVVDAFEPGNHPVLVVGNGGAANEGGVAGNANPPVGGEAAAGPTAWDWVAIGLSAAALADSLADRGRPYVDDGVVVERPVVQTTPVTETVVVSEEPVVVSEEPEAELVGQPVAAEVAAQVTAQPLPQLPVGKAFELPAKGLGSKPGRVAVKVGAVILECPVSTWSDAGFKATVAEMTLEKATPADLIVALADGSVAAKIPVEIVPGADRSAGRTK